MGILSQICEIFKSRYVEKYKLDPSKICRVSLGSQKGFVDGPALQNIQNGGGRHLGFLHKH